MARGDTKLIALDIDGTIIEKTAGVPVHRKVRAAVNEARAAGHKVCLCSARPGYYMRDATEGLDEIDAVIGCSGALIEKDGEVIHKDPIALPILLACFETAKRLDTYMSFAGDDKIYVCKKGPVLPPLEGGSVFVIIEDEELLRVLREKDIYCAFVFTKKGVQKESIFTDEAFKGAAIHKSSMNSFDLVNIETNKGTGVLFLAEQYGITSENVIAIGNDENDVPMFRAAGTGVAMANASPEVRAAADWIAPDVRKGGAAEAIRRFAL